MIVIIARDKTVNKIKGKKPINNEIKRAIFVENTKIPNRVILGKIRDKYAIIKQNKPDIIALGYDQNIFTQNLKKELAKQSLKPKIIRLKPYKPHIYKSSLISRRLD